MMQNWAAGRNTFYKLDNSVGWGALGGAGGALARNIINGAPIRLDDEKEVNLSNMRDNEGNYSMIARKGGLMGWLIRTYNMFGDVNFDEGDEAKCDVVMHEAWHSVQFGQMGLAWTAGRELYEYMKYGDPGMYYQQGTVEYEADYNRDRY